jgi:hypothetical protein
MLGATEKDTECNRIVRVRLRFELGSGVIVV